MTAVEAEDGERSSVPESPDEPPSLGERWARRILPRSILGLASLLFFMAMAAAFSGAVLFAYYRFELEDTKDRVTDVENSIADEVDRAAQILADERDAAVDEIDALLDELERFEASGSTMAELLAAAEPSVFFVNTFDENGLASVGTAFVLFSDSDESALLTSYTTIRAATVNPGPAITLTKNGEPVDAILETWDPARDLALLIVRTPNLPALPRAEPSTVTVGDRIFAVSGLGASGGSIVQGVVADTAANGIQHDAGVGPQFQGGPMLNARGELVGIASRSYAPVGFASDATWFAVPWREACAQVVGCEGI